MYEIILLKAQIIQNQSLSSIIQIPSRKLNICMNFMTVWRYCRQLLQSFLSLFKGQILPKYTSNNINTWDSFYNSGQFSCFMMYFSYSSVWFSKSRQCDAPFKCVCKYYIVQPYPPAWWTWSCNMLIHQLVIVGPTGGLGLGGYICVCVCLLMCFLCVPLELWPTNVRDGCDQTRECSRGPSFCSLLFTGN